MQKFVYFIPHLIGLVFSKCLPYPINAKQKNITNVASKTLTSRPNLLVRPNKLMVNLVMELPIIHKAYILNNKGIKTQDYTSLNSTRN